MTKSRVQKSANKERKKEREKERNIQDLKNLGQKLDAKLRNGVCIKISVANMPVADAAINGKITTAS